MAPVVDLLSEALDQRAVGRFAAMLGIDAADARKLTNAAVPLLLERLASNAKGGDASAIARALTKDHDGTVLSAAATFLGGGFRQGSGMAILEHVFDDEVDTAVASVAESTGLPPDIVRLGFTALAPLVMGAMAKAAIGAITGVVVMKLLDVSVDQIRSGKAREIVGRVNRRLDADADGSSLDDVGRSAVQAGKKAGSAAIAAGASVASNARVRRTASSGTKAGARLAGKAAKSGTDAAGQAAKSGAEAGARLAGKAVGEARKGASKAVGSAKKKLGRFFGR